MQGFGFQQVTTVTVPASLTATVLLAPSRPPLQELTVWAVSGTRTVPSLTFQARVNQQPFGTSVSVTTSPAATIVSGENVTYTGDILFPQGIGMLNMPEQSSPTIDPFDFDIFISNGDANPVTVTLYFVGVGREGGVRR